LSAILEALEKIGGGKSLDRDMVRVNELIKVPILKYVAKYTPQLNSAFFVVGQLATQQSNSRWVTGLQKPSA
jgi:hypothetical protein